ncbi:uncharacterized protein [Periplaneta americana]
MKKQCGYLQEWLDKSWSFQQQPDGPYAFEEEPVSRVPGFRSAPCWPNHSTVPVLDRRLFPTVSEPTMCRYSVPVGYSLEPISLPVYATYVPMSSDQAASSSRRRGSKPVARSNGMHGSFSSAPHSYWQAHRDFRRNSSRPKPGVDSTTNEDFTSLPPAVTAHTPDTVRRRFSDPGIGRPPVTVDGARPPCCSGDTSDSGDSCSRASTPEPLTASNGLVMSLMEQVNALQDSNKQLYQELRETKAEVETLKQSWRQLPPDYEPGMVSDLIREIRDATRVREEVLLSRVCGLLEGVETLNSANHVLDLKDKLEKGPVGSTKLGNLDQLLQQLEIHRDKTKLSGRRADGTADTQAKEMCALELENLQLRRGLQESVARIKDKESQAQQLERLVDVLRRKINGVSVDEKPASSEQSPSESLVSTVSSSSTAHSPHVTMSGPVTDL